MLKILLISSIFLLTQGCRVVQDQPSGGIAVSREDHSSVVLIETFIDYDRSYWCTGVLITSNFVLTTARCVVEALFANLHINAFKLLDEFEKGREIHRAVDFIYKPNFERYINHNDIALVKTPITLNLAAKTYKTAKLPTSELPENSQGMSIGWGLFDFYDRDEHATEVKNEISLKFLTNFECQLAYPRLNWTYYGIGGRGCLKNSETFNCVSGYGSPFFINDEVHALHSFGALEECNNEMPNGVQLTFYHLQWIKENSDYQ